MEAIIYGLVAGGLAAVGMAIALQFPSVKAKQEATKQRRAAAKAQQREDRELLRD
jgi:ethanolamine transporter EutH